VARLTILAALMLGRPPSIPDALFDADILRPCQWPGARCARAAGPRALLLRLLADAVYQADLGVRRQGPGPRHGSGRFGARRRPAQIVAARRWLAGELDDQVRLPIAFVCDALGLDHDVLAAAVRARATL
jgi:hypothetical protein